MNKREVNVILEQLDEFIAEAPTVIRAIYDDEFGDHVTETTVILEDDIDRLRKLYYALEKALED